MSEQQIEANRLLVNRFYHELWNEHQFEIAEEIMTEDVIFHGALGKETKGITGLIDYIKKLYDTFPDFRISVEDLDAEEQKIASCLTYRGTHEAEIFGIEPQGQLAQFVGVGIFIVRADLITHVWELGDRLTLLQQLNEPDYDDSILDMDSPPADTREKRVPEWDE